MVTFGQMQRKWSPAAPERIMASAPSALFLCLFSEEKFKHRIGPSPQPGTFGRTFRLANALWENKSKGKGGRGVRLIASAGFCCGFNRFIYGGAHVLQPAEVRTVPSESQR